MQVTLSPGEVLNVQFAECDGEFAVHFDTSEYPQALVVKETAGLPGSVKGGAEEILYHEKFGQGIPEVFDRETDGEEVHEGIKRAAHAGFFMDALGVAQSTQLVRCQLDHEDHPHVVETLNAENEVTGAFTFYKTMEELEAALGGSYPQLTI